MPIAKPSDNLANVSGRMSPNTLVQRPANMKHLDMKSRWIRMLRDRKEVDTMKVQGEQNEADFFTRIFAGQAFKEAEQQLMPKVHC